MHGILCLLLLLISGCMASTETPEVLLERANMLQSRGEFEEAIRIYGRVLNHHPDDADVCFQRGICYERVNLPERAIEDYQRCLEIVPAHVDALNNSGVILARIGRHEEAVTRFSELISLTPGSVLAWRNRGLCFHDLEQTERALADYNHGLSIEPNDVETLFQRGNLFLDTGQFAEAESDYTSAIDAAPDYAGAWMNRGVARFRLGMAAEAMEDLQHARELDNNIVIPDLDWLLAQQAVNVTAAKPILEPVSVWSEALQFAVDHLSGTGYANIETIRNHRRLRCAKLTAQIGNDAVEIFVALAADENAASVSIPSEAANDVAKRRTLIVLVPDLSESSADTGFRVLRQVDNWKPHPDTIRPVISELTL